MTNGSHGVTALSLRPPLSARDKNFVFLRLFVVKNPRFCTKTDRAGLNVHPGAINVYPDLINVHPDLINVHPDWINVHPDLINVYPGGINVHPDLINVHPDWINVHPGGIVVHPDWISVHPGAIRQSGKSAKPMNSSPKRKRGGILRLVIYWRFDPVAYAPGCYSFVRSFAARRALARASNIDS